MFYFKKKPPAVVAEGLTACLPGSQIIGFLPLKPYFNEIRQLVSAPTDVYEQFYLSTLCGVAEFCQAMPFSQTHFTGDYGLLKRQLMLTIAALKLRRGKLLPKQGEIETIAAEEAAWTYALFSTSLLRDLHMAQHNRIVTLHQANGEAAGSWVPLSGSLYEKSRYYRLEWATNKEVTDTAILMAVLAGRIIPPAVIRWLADKNTLYALWWETLLHEPKEGNVLQAIIAEAGEKSETLLPEEKTQQALLNHSPISLDQLTAWLISKLKDCPEQMFQVEQGFFVSEIMLDDFLSDTEKAEERDKKEKKEKINKAVFLQQLAKTGALILKENNFFHALVPKQFEDRRVIKGIMLNKDFLPEILQRQPINLDFKEHIPL